MDEAVAHKADGDGANCNDDDCRGSGDLMCVADCTERLCTDDRVDYRPSDASNAIQDDGDERLRRRESVPSSEPEAGKGCTHREVAEREAGERKLS